MSKRKLWEKKCARCGKTFVAVNGNSKYCSDRCRKEAVSESKRRSLMKELAGEANTLVCHYCGKEFPIRPGHPFYCSKECLEKAKGEPLRTKKTGPSLADKYAVYKKRVLQQGGKPLSYGYFVAQLSMEAVVKAEGM